MRRRHQLRPDTFPFLAVLLCAMGSLILVLMELDRRARSEAHHRAEQGWLQTQREKAEKHVEESRSSGDRLTRDLLLLEEALARLKVQRQRQGKTWSIVPYVGKRGMNRKPMYVECDADGLLFHPDNKRIDSRDSSLL